MADRIPLVISGSSIREIPSSDRLDVQGALEVNGHITPGADSAYDIGTSSLKFRDIFLSSGTIHLGGVKLKADGNKLSIQDSAGATAGITTATLGVISTDNLDEGSTNLFTTAARTRSHISVTDAGGDGSTAYNASTGVITYTGPSASETRAHIIGGHGVDFALGNISVDSSVIRGLVSATDAGGDGSFAYNNSTGVFTYTGPSAAETRAHVSATDAGGDGSFAYNSSTGAFTYTGPSASEVRAHISAGTGVAVSSGAISIGQAVATTDSVTFAGLYASGNVILGGNLTVNGTTTTVNSTNSLVADPLIELNTGAGSNANDLGFVFERGSTGNNAAFIWDESEDKFKLGTTTATGASTGNMTVATGSLIANLVGNVTGNVTGNVSGTAGSATGNAATATALATARTIGGTSFDGTANIAVGLAATATALATARTIGGTSFDGTGNIAVALAAEATALATARTIGGVSFDGTGNINLPGVNTAGNQATSGLAATATKLATTRAIQISGDATGTANFDGSAAINISVALAANTVTSSELASASTLLIKNVAGTTLKTVIGAGS